MRSKKHKLGSRIVIVGSGGSGKSTLAVVLGEITGLPVIHLDKEFWRPGWVEPTKDEWKEKTNELISSDKWIIDGNYSGTLEMRLERADTVIFLDLGRAVCIFSILKRWITNRNKVRSDMAAGCPEKMDLEFLLWVWNFKKRSRPKIISRIEDNKDKNIIILKSRREVKNFLKRAASYLQLIKM